MTNQNHESEGKGRRIDPAEYRHRLLTKLNCLISVLEVAIGKIAQSMEDDTSNRDRLSRIKTNLESTLAICRRAKSTLQAKIAESKPDVNILKPKPRRATDSSATGSSAPISFRNYVELSSIEEFRKFKNLDAITHEDVRETDIEALARRLLDEE